MTKMTQVAPKAIVKAKKKMKVIFQMTMPWIHKIKHIKVMKVNPLTSTKLSHMRIIITKSQKS